MNPRLVITFVVCFISVSSSFGSNVWGDFDAHEIYPVYDLSNCEFPFTYKGKSYDNCTTDGDNGNRPWCSLTGNYVGLFTYCYDFWQSTLKCNFPFTLNGKTYDKCDILSKTVPYKQCRSNNPNYRFRFCIEEYVKKSGKKLLHTSTCDPVYRSMSEVHSKCAGPSDFAIPIDISDSEKDSILTTHNQYRAAVGAKTMFKMYWDDELAKMAQVHSDMCAFDHDESNNRLTVSYKWKNGQNMVMSTEIRNTLSDLLTIMFDSEKPRFNYGVGCNPPGSCTHYTQLMLSNMTRLGCGVTHCMFPDRIERYLTCNYIHAQYSNNFMIPYVPGSSSGSDCPSSKDSTGLCDCGNKICDYDKGEYLNPDTCKCQDGSRKRFFDENNLEERNTDEEELEKPSQAFIAVQDNTGLESNVEDKRNMKFLPVSNNQRKRHFRKLNVNRREQGQMADDLDSMGAFSEAEMESK